MQQTTVQENGTAKSGLVQTESVRSMRVDENHGISSEEKNHIGLLSDSVRLVTLHISDNYTDRLKAVRQTRVHWRPGDSISAVSHIYQMGAGKGPLDCCEL